MTTHSHNTLLNLNLPKSTAESASVDQWRKRIVTTLWLTVAGLLLMHIANRAFGEATDIALFEMAMDKFHLDAEQNIPTWFSSVLILLAGLGVGGLAWHEKRIGSKDAWRYAFLAVVLFYMSCDESARLHEMPAESLRERLNLTGLLYSGWILVAAVMVLAVGFLMLPLVKRASPRLRWAALVGAGVYLTGAIGGEMIGSLMVADYGKPSFQYFLVSTFEETCEMVGMLIFLTGVLAELADRFRGARLEAVPTAGETA